MNESKIQFPAIREEKEFLLLKVCAAPGSSRSEVSGLRGDALRVAVCAPPEKGKANDAIVKVLAHELGLRRSQVSLHRGETSREKWIRIDGLTAERLRIQLRRALR